MTTLIVFFFLASALVFVLGLERTDLYDEESMVGVLLLVVGSMGMGATTTLFTLYLLP